MEPGPKPRLMRVYADETGETHLAEVHVPGPAEPTVGSSRSRVLRDVPTTTLDLVEATEHRPKLDLHPPPRRQLVVVLRGTIEITATDGDRRRFGPGDVLLAEDMIGKGHYYEDVGEDLPMTISIGIPDHWSWPGT